MTEADARVRSDRVSILIVEDETIVALDMRSRLEAFGYEVCSIADTGAKALDSAKAHLPCLILMDIKLKGPMDGIEAATLVRAWADIPIIFVTAFTDEVTLDRVKAASPYGYIVKPYHERELRITIELALSKYRYERELKAAKDQAETSDRAKSRFLSNISHELKTPLNVIVGFTDLAAGARPGEDVREYVSMAARGARRLETMIDSLLDYTKLEAGALAPFCSEFDLEAMLLGAWEPFACDAYSKGLAVRLYQDPGLPALVYGDQGKLCTLVRNLIDNAVKFTESGYVLLSAELAKGDVAELVIRVCDTGMGISTDKRRSLFGRFMQGDDSLTRPVGGLGLGLSLAKGLADLLGARIDLEEASEGGTRFSLAFPLPAGSPAARAPFAPRSPTRRLAVLGPCPAEQDLAALGRYMGFDVVTGDAGASAQGDALVADSGYWRELGEAGQASAAESVGGPGHVILIDRPSAPLSEPSGAEPARLRYPLGLGPLLSALERAFDGASPPEAGAPSDGAQVRAPAAGPEPELRDYERLCRDAVAEAGREGLLGTLEILVADVAADLASGDQVSAERHAKRAHDEFAEASALSCERLALAVSMDARKGTGQWEKRFVAAMGTVLIGGKHG